MTTMPEKADIYTPEVLALMARKEDVVPADAIAPIVHMHPSVIIKYVKEDRWPREICNYIVSGSHVKFFRVDFLRKNGFLDSAALTEGILGKLDELTILLNALVKQETASCCSS